MVAFRTAGLLDFVQEYSLEGRFSMRTWKILGQKGIVEYRHHHRHQSHPYPLDHPAGHMVVVGRPVAHKEAGDYSAGGKVAG